MAGEDFCQRKDQARLLAAARQGDPAAFGELYKQYLSDVRGFCARRISDPARAEDLAQETFLRAFERITRHREGMPFWPWIATIARNLCIDELRRRARLKEDTTADLTDEMETLPRWSDADSTAETVLARQDALRSRAVLARALASLDSRQRVLLWQHDVEELSYEEIAQANGTTIHAARNAAWRARSLLKAAIGSSVGDLRLVIAPAIELLRRLRRRIENGTSRLRVSTVGDSGILAEVGAFLLVGVMLASASWPGIEPHPVTGSRPPLLMAPGTSSADVPLKQQSDPGPGAPSFGEESGTASVLDVSLDTKEPRDGGAAPSAAYLRVEVYGSAGEKLYWQETELDCGPGTDMSLARQGPVRAYC